MKLTTLSAALLRSARLPVSGGRGCHGLPISGLHCRAVGVTRGLLSALPTALTATLLLTALTTTLLVWRLLTIWRRLLLAAILIGRRRIALLRLRGQRQSQHQEESDHHQEDVTCIAVHQIAFHICASCGFIPLRHTAAAEG